MKKINILFLGGALSMAFLSSCDAKNEFIGDWQAVNPVDISDNLPSVAKADALTSVTFLEDGNVYLTSIINATQPVVENPGLDSGYEVSVAATASISGTWAYDHGSDDDLLLTLNDSTLKVNVDNSGVTFRQNDITGAQVPVTDSLTVATVELWNNQLTSAMQKLYTRYYKLDDIKVKGGKTMKFEIDHPEMDMIFNKIE